MKIAILFGELGKWAGWLLFSVIVVAILEYVAHRFFMHRPLMDRFGLPGVFHNHTIIHHKYNRLDQNVDLPVRTHFLWGWPLLIGISWIDWAGVATLVITFIVHAVTWSALHRAIHNLERNWTMKVPWFARWKEHHENHHRFPGRNFGAVFPFTDHLFATAVRSKAHNV